MEEYAVSPLIFQSVFSTSADISIIEFWILPGLFIADITEDITQKLDRSLHPLTHEKVAHRYQIYVAYKV